VDALPFMAWADSVPLRVAWEASKHSVERTMPDAPVAAKREAALAKFHDAIYRTQNGTSSTEISGFGSEYRRNPLAMPLLMFKSDLNKKANLLLQMRRADPATRAKVLLAVGLNALAGSLAGYGLKAGAAAVGRAIGGAEPDPDAEQKLRADAMWDFARQVAGVSYFGDGAMDFARALANRRFSADIGSPVGQATRDFVDDLLRLTRAAGAWAQTASGDPKADKAFRGMLRAGEHFLMTGSVMLGNPLVPPYRLARRAAQAGTFEPEDPRLGLGREEEKTRGEESRRLRTETPGLLKLLDERRELDRKGGLGDRRLTPQERERKHYLDGAHRVYLRHLAAIREAQAHGDDAAAQRVRGSLAAAVGDPDRLAFEAELTTLRAKRDAYNEAKRLLKDPARRQEATQAIKAGRVTSLEEYRLGRLESTEKALKAIEQRVQRGETSQEEASRLARRYLGLVKRKPAA
jgi:hypothetical protein